MCRVRLPQTELCIIAEYLSNYVLLCIIKKTRDYIRIINIARPIDGEFHLRSSRNGPGIIFQVFFNEFTAIWSIITIILIKSKIDHNNTDQIPISAAERLEITLWILATGNSQQTVAIARELAIANQYAGAGAGEVWIGLYETISAKNA